MRRNSDWSTIPVWRCTDSSCDEQWATKDVSRNCPFCYHGRGELTGFTCGELAAAAEKYGFKEELPAHIPEPVPELVQLSTLPQHTWVGLPVFHPHGQQNDQANWLLYDVGIVIEVYPDPDFPSEMQCRRSINGRTVLHITLRAFESVGPKGSCRPVEIGGCSELAIPSLHLGMLT